MLEADPSLESRIVPALHKFVALANTMLHNGQGQDDWAKTRWEDFVMVLQWYVAYPASGRVSVLIQLFSRLYDFHPDGQEDVLIDTMKMLKWQGDPWEQVFAEKVSLF